MKLIYLNQSINFINSKGIDIIIPEGAEVIEHDTHVIFKTN